MLTPDLSRAVEQHLAHIVHPIELWVSAGTDGLFQLASDIAAASNGRIRVLTDVEHSDTPSLRVARSNTDIAVRFIGLPLGHQFSALVLAVLHVGGHPPRYSSAVTTTAEALEGHFEFETYFAQDCQSCPETLQALNALAVLNPHVTHTAIDGALFPDEMVRRDIQAVPVVYLNGRRFADGRMGLEQILTRLAREDTSSDED